MIFSLVCVSIVTCLIIYRVYIIWIFCASKFKHNCSNFFFSLSLHISGIPHTRSHHILQHFLFFLCVFFSVVLLLLFYHQNNKPLWQTGKDKWMLFYIYIIVSGFHLRHKTYIVSNGIKQRWNLLWKLF